MIDVHYDVQIIGVEAMQETTFTELRAHAKRYFDAVERGETVRLLRNGKAIAEIIPIRAAMPSWKRSSLPMTIKGLDLSREIIKDRVGELTSSESAKSND